MCDVDEGDARGDIAVPRRSLRVPIHCKVRHDRHNDDERAGEALKFRLSEKCFSKLILLRQYKIGLLRPTQGIDELLQPLRRQALRRAEHRKAAYIGKYFLNLKVDRTQGLKGNKPPVIAEGENCDVLLCAHYRLCARPKKTYQYKHKHHAHGEPAQPHRAPPSFSVPEFVDEHTYII